MSYTLFSKDYTISADEVRENFEWVRQGDLLPHGNANLELTDGVYDLGSDVYEWAEVHTNNIDITGEVNECWNLISDITLEETASSIEITGLNGDEDRIYWIKSKIIFAITAVAYLIFNDDDASNYGYQILSLDGSGYAALRSDSPGVHFIKGLYGTTTAKLSISECFIYAKQGQERMVLLSVMASCGEDYIDQARMKPHIWNDTSDTLTTMKIEGSLANAFRTNTSIQIWTLR